MSRLLVGLAVAALSGAATAAGCGIGPGEAAEGEATLTVTRDYGAEAIGGGTLADPTPSDTVIRFLDEEADIETSYGGNFVDSIDGLEGSTVTGGREDWFFFVNGIYSDVGAGEAVVRPGDRIWWDYRRWAEAYRVPAVVGSWPEPFLHGYDGGPPAVVVECLAPSESCDDVVASLRDEGVEPELETPPEPVSQGAALRILVGEWDRLRADPAARMIEAGPGTSGVYAELERCGPGGWDLTVLGSDAQPRLSLPEAGFVAAVRRAEEGPTWLVTATDEASLPAAAALLGEPLRDRYAVAAAGDEQQPIPADDEAPPIAGGCP